MCGGNKGEKEKMEKCKKQIINISESPKFTKQDLEKEIKVKNILKAIKETQGTEMFGRSSGAATLSIMKWNLYYLIKKKNGKNKNELTNKI